MVHIARYRWICVVAVRRAPKKKVFFEVLSDSSASRRLLRLLTDAFDLTPLRVLSDLVFRGFYETWISGIAQNQFKDLCPMTNRGCYLVRQGAFKHQRHLTWLIDNRNNSNWKLQSPMSRFQILSLIGGGIRGAFITSFCPTMTFPSSCFSSW